MDFSKLSIPNAPRMKISPPGPKSKKHLEFQTQHEGATVSYPRGMPMALKRARGATIEDVDGNVYLDFFGGAGVMAVGHSNPEVVEKVKDQLGKVTHSLDIPSPVRSELVKLLISILPESLNKVVFGGPTGSDAVEAALKLARINTQRYPVIAFQGAYHGMTSGALSVTSDRTHKKGLLPLLAEVHFIPYAYCYRCVFNRKPNTCELECAKFLEYVLDDPHSGISDPCAVIVEAIQGEGGSIVPPYGFIRKVREICSKYNVIMIADEIQSGFCRTGKMFSYQHEGIVPDIVTLSKALGGIGLPISCIAYKDSLDKWNPGLHIGTFRGNLLAYAGGSAAIRFMLKYKLESHAQEIGKVLLNSLKPLEKDSEIVGEVRGKGLMLGVEIVSDKASKAPSSDLAKKLRTACHQKGLLIEIGGHYGNVARFLPPLVITEKLAIKGAEIFADAVKSVEKRK
jgi:diaminobutyrate-2-oxoglutarate transaminase